MAKLTKAQIKADINSTIYDNDNQEIEAALHNNLLNNVNDSVMNEKEPLCEGNLDANQHKIINLSDPTNDQDAVNKRFMDDAIGGIGGADLHPYTKVIHVDTLGGDDANDGLYETPMLTVEAAWEKRKLDPTFKYIIYAHGGHVGLFWKDTLELNGTEVTGTYMFTYLYSDIPGTGEYGATVNHLKLTNCGDIAISGISVVQDITLRSDVAPTRGIMVGSKAQGTVYLIDSPNQNKSLWFTGGSTAEIVTVTGNTGGFNLAIKNSAVKLADNSGLGSVEMLGGRLWVASGKFVTVAGNLTMYPGSEINLEASCSFTVTGNFTQYGGLISKPSTATFSVTGTHTQVTPPSSKYHGFNPSGSALIATNVEDAIKEASTVGGGGDVPSTRQIATIDSLQGGGDLSSDRTLSLVGDILSPGGNMRYGTNENGERGWYPPASTSYSGKWTYQNLTAPPATGNGVRLNSADPTLATQMYIAENAVGNINFAVVFGLLKAGDIVRAQQADNPDEYTLFNLTGPGADSGSSWTFPISLINTTTSVPPTNNETLNLVFSDIDESSGGIPDAPADGNLYGRRDNAWDEVAGGTPPIDTRYVHTVTGLDTNNGAFDTPYKTFEKALEDRRAYAGAFYIIFMNTATVTGATLNFGQSVTSYKTYLIPYLPGIKLEFSSCTFLDPYIPDLHNCDISGTTKLNRSAGVTKTLSLLCYSNDVTCESTSAFISDNDITGLVTSISYYGVYGTLYPAAGTDQNITLGVQDGAVMISLATTTTHGKTTITYGSLTVTANRSMTMTMASSSNTFIRRITLYTGSNLTLIGAGGILTIDEVVYATATNPGTLSISGFSKVQYPQSKYHAFSPGTSGITATNVEDAIKEVKASGGGGGVPTTRLISTTNSITGGGDLSIDRTHALVGDVASPGNSKLYGTNASGTRGWYNQYAGYNYSQIIYVDTVNGNSVNSGTYDKPLKTLQAALTLRLTSTYNTKDVMIKILSSSSHGAVTFDATALSIAYLTLIEGPTVSSLLSSTMNNTITELSVTNCGNLFIVGCAPSTILMTQTSNLYCYIDVMGGTITSASVVSSVDIGKCRLSLSSSIYDVSSSFTGNVVVNRGGSLRINASAVTIGGVDVSLGGLIKNEYPTNTLTITKTTSGIYGDILNNGTIILSSYAGVEATFSPTSVIRTGGTGTITLPVADQVRYPDSIRHRFDPGTSGITATNVEDAIKEVKSSGGSGGGIPEAPTDGKQYGRQSSSWTEIIGNEGVPETRNISTTNSITGGGNLSTDRTHTLVGDVASPGNNKLYGTNASGTRGWYDQPTGSGGGIPDAPSDGLLYGRKDAAWEAVPASEVTGGVTEAPSAIWTYENDIARVTLTADLDVTSVAANMPTGPKVKYYTHGAFKLTVAGNTNFISRNGEHKVILDNIGTQTTPVYRVTDGWKAYGVIIGTTFDDSIPIKVDATREFSTIKVVTGATHTISAAVSGNVPGNYVLARYQFDVNCTVTFDSFDDVSNTIGPNPIPAGTYNLWFFATVFGVGVVVQNNT